MRSSGNRSSRAPRRARWEGHRGVGSYTEGLQSEDASADLQRELMVSRLKQTLAHSRAPRISDNELREDWQLLEKIDVARHEALSKKLDQGNELLNQ